MGPDQKPVLRHRAEVPPQGDLGRAQRLRHLGDRDGAAGADALRYEPPAFQGEHVRRIVLQRSHSINIGHKRKRTVDKTDRMSIVRHCLRSERALKHGQSAHI